MQLLAKGHISFVPAELPTVHTTKVEFLEEFYVFSNDADAYPLSCPEQILEIKCESKLHLEEPQLIKLEATKRHPILPSRISFIYEYCSSCPHESIESLNSVELVESFFLFSLPIQIS